MYRDLSSSSSTKMKPLYSISMLALTLLLLFPPSVMSMCGGKDPDFVAMKNIYGQLSLKHLMRNSTSDYCSWEGVVHCSSDCYVQELNLSSRNLFGIIPRDISNLANLTTLDLSHNNFSGDIPGDLRLPQSLLYINLGWNALEHGILWSLAISCFQLEEIHLEHNQPYGGLRFLTECSNLAVLNIGNNLLTGSIPPEFGGLHHLQALDLSFNRLGGAIPDDIYNAPSLLTFSVQGNILTTLNNTPDGIIWRNLQTLDMSNNIFSCPIPTKLFNLSPLSSINLSRNQFVGNLPEEVGALTNLIAFDVSHNNLSGKIPSSLENLNQLQFLDLSYNDFEGPVPTGGIFTQSGHVSLVGYTQICPSLYVPACNGIAMPPPGENRPNGGQNDKPGISGEHLPPVTKSRSGFPKAALAVVVVIAVACFMFLLFWQFYKRRIISNENLGDHLKDIAFFKAPSPVLLTHADLEIATQGFLPINLIGSGTIGSVYRGFLEQGKKQVAVKLLHMEALTGDSRRLMEESLELQSIKHKNLVGMIASCFGVDSLGNQFAAWLYDLMPKGNLEMWLHAEVESQALTFRKWNLSWYQRLNMAIDVASALVHLHCKLEIPMVLCNLKPSNILIAQDLTACLMDFGMVRYFPINVVIRNSRGYVAPECENGNTISPMCDVYSFGVILLEMLTGKRPINEAFPDGSSLRKYVIERSLSSGSGGHTRSAAHFRRNKRQTDRVIPRMLKLNYTCSSLKCSSNSPQDRMGMAEALEVLEGIKH